MLYSNYNGGLSDHLVLFDVTEKLLPAGVLGHGLSPLGYSVLGSPGRTNLTAIWISLEVMVILLL